MSKTMLWVVIGAAAFVVVVLAVLTPTVIVGDDDHDGRGVRVTAPAAGGWTPYGFGQGRLPELKRCLQDHGFGGQRGTLPTPDQLRNAFRDCAPRLGG